MGSLTTGLDHTKRCLRCRDEKPLTEFYACKGMLDGRDSTCRSCKIAANRQRREQTKLGTGSLLRLSPKCSRGELSEETFESRRDSNVSSPSSPRLHVGDSRSKLPVPNLVCSRR